MTSAIYFRSIRLLECIAYSSNSECIRACLMEYWCACFRNGSMKFRLSPSVIVFVLYFVIFVPNVNPIRNECAFISGATHFSLLLSIHHTYLSLDKHAYSTEQQQKNPFWILPALLSLFTQTEIKSQLQNCLCEFYHGRISMNVRVFERARARADAFTI